MDKSNGDELTKCYGKVKHQSYSNAFRSLKRGKGKIRVYKCEHCGFYHIGHKIKNRR